MLNSLADSYLGSSPLSWGKPRIPSTISFDIRIIPTHAGKTTQTA